MTSAGGPLAGVKMVELAGIGPAPFACMMLADLGAEVVVVDRPRTDLEFAHEEKHNVVARGKRAVVHDLKNPAGRAAVLDLVADADVLVEGMRPGVAERLGVGPEDCWKRNRKLVYARMTGWGQSGPLASTAGHDIGYIAITGALHAIGAADGPPQMPVNLLGDFGGGGTYLVIGILSALREAERTGRGLVVDAAIVDGTAHLLASLHSMLAAGLWRDQRGVNLLDGGASFYGVYATADDKYIVVGALEHKFYLTLLAKLGLEPEDAEAQYDQRKWPEKKVRFAEIFSSRTRDEWVAVFDGSDACVAPVMSLREAADHPHLRARGTIFERDGVMQPAPAPRFQRPAQ